MNDITLRKWRAHRGQTNFRFNFTAYLQEGQLGVVFEDLSW